MLPFILILVASLALGLQYSNPALGTEADESTDTSEARRQGSSETQSEEGSAGNLSESQPGQNITVAKNITKAIRVPEFGLNFSKAQPPDTVHLRIQIDSIDIYHDHDSGLRADGDWYLFGTVSCCGGAANSNMPTQSFSFNAPGVKKEGEIDTPDNQMYDVTGERRGGWGTVETVKFTDVYQDLDVDNTNPLTEVHLNIFGVEDDALQDSDLPPIPDVKESFYDEIAKGVEKTIQYLNNLAGSDDLGKIHQIFNRANNYGIGADSVGFGSLASDDVYRNFYFVSQAAETACAQNSGKTFGPIYCSDKYKKDWPDYSDYVLNIRIMDKEKRCDGQGMIFEYATGNCKGVPFQ